MTDEELAGPLPERPHPEASPMRALALALAAATLLAALASARSQADSAGPRTTPQPAVPDTQRARPGQFAPVPAAGSLPAEPQGGAPMHTGPAPGAAPPRDYVAEVRSNFTPESRAYSVAHTALEFVAPFYSVLVALILLASGLSAKMRDVAHDVARGRYPRVLVYFALFSAATFVLTLPLAWVGDYALEHRYELSTQSLGGWLGDQVKSLLMQVALFGVVPVLAVAYRRLELSPRRWWLWFSALTLPLLTAGVLITPLVVEPAFNKFTPLRDAHLRDRILALAARADIPARRVDQVDMSRQTSKYGAYVSGFGPSQHVVLWDTTLRGMDESEILYVTGHEIGHYAMHHIWKGIAFDTALGVVLFFLTWLIARPLVRRLGPGWGFDELHDLAAMPLLAAVLGLVFVALSPVLDAYSREVEHEADAYGLEITRDNDAAARAFIKLASQNRADPEPSTFVKCVLFDHPPLVERVRFAASYHPWTEGRPNRFFHEPAPAHARSGVAQPRRMTVRQEGAVRLAASRGAATTEAKRGACSPASRRQGAIPSDSKTAVEPAALTIARRFSS